MTMVQSNRVQLQHRFEEHQKSQIARTDHCLANSCCFSDSQRLMNLSNLLIFKYEVSTIFDCYTKRHLVSSHVDLS